MTKTFIKKNLGANAGMNQPLPFRWIAKFWDLSWILAVNISAKASATNKHFLA